MIKKEYLTPKVLSVAFHIELGQQVSLSGETTDNNSTSWDNDNTPQPEGSSTTNYFETNW